MVPEDAVAQIERFCDQRSDDPFRLEFEVRGASITLIERRPPWAPEAESEWTSQPVAQLRHDADARTWSLYWPRASGRWTRYEDRGTAVDVAALLAEIDADPDGVFWG